MFGRILALLLAVAEITRLAVRHMERNRAAALAEENDEKVKELEANPAEWVAKHFGKNATVTVHACDHDIDPSELREPTSPVSSAAIETDPDGDCDGGRGCVL